MRTLLLCVLDRLLLDFSYLLPAVPREVADEFVECVFRCPVRNLNEQVYGAKRTPLPARQLDGRFKPSVRHRPRQVLTFLSSIIRGTRRPDDDVAHPDKTIPPVTAPRVTASGLTGRSIMRTRRRPLLALFRRPSGKPPPAVARRTVRRSEGVRGLSEDAIRLCWGFAYLRKKGGAPRWTLPSSLSSPFSFFSPRS
jgi:hypothetical protein